ncbi:MAG: glycosyltransferase family 4 protein [Anaerolineales bacterium]|nr:MAG: glycosyltransferase family 4 protein [Anaerolineales bacterium]
MKALYVAGDTKFGGGVQRTVSLVRMVRHLGWQVDALVTDSEVQDAVREAGAGIVDLDVIRRPIRPLWDLRRAYRLYQFLRGSDYELVHTATSKGGFVGRLAARLAGVPVIIHTAAGFAFHGQSTALERHLYALLERLAAHWCDRIITVSETHRNWALRLGIGHPGLVKAIQSGIPLARVAPTQPTEQTRAELGLAPSDFVVLSAGRLARQKGLEYLIQAVPLLLPHLDSGLRILLAGEGPLRAALEEQARHLGVQAQLEFLGFRRDIGDLLAVSEAVVLPSLWEGLSISVLEAMAAEKPIVTTSLESNQELLRHGETGLLVPPKQPHPLAQAILMLADDPKLRSRLGTAAGQVFRTHFTEDRMVDEYRAEYLALCKEKGLTW